MAIATTTAIALALAAASAGAQYYNTEHTAHQQDSQLATSLRNQAGKQKLADSKVNDEVNALKASTAEASRQKTQGEYMNTLRDGKAKATAGLTPGVGSDAFKSDSAAASQGVQDFGAKNAGLMARIDAPTQQRQQEAFGYGNLGTDLNLIQRDAQGQNFLDELRLRAIRRNAGIDAGAALLGGAASGVSAQGATTSTGPSQFGPYASGYKYPSGYGS